MVEIDLENLEEWYNEKIDEVYMKHRQVLKKYLSKVEKYLIDLKSAENKMLERKSEVNLDDKSEKFLDRFYEKIKVSLNAIEVPQHPTFYNVNDLKDEIQKLFLSMHEAGRKNIRAFSEQFKIELKEIDMITRKIGDELRKIDKFLRKKYDQVREAEAVNRKIPKLQSLVERISNSKSTVYNLTQQNKDLKAELENMEEEIIKIENHPLYKEKTKIEKDLMQLRLIFNEKLKFKKVLKKLKKYLEKKSFKGITSSDVKQYISNPIKAITSEGESHPHLTEFLVQVRYLLETDNSFQIKSDSKEKALENIDQIVSKGMLKEIINEYNVKKERVREIKKKLEKEQLSDQLDEIKEKVSLKTQEFDHLSSDLKYQQSEYRNLLEKLKEERDELQNDILKYTEEEVKINIVFSY